MLAGDVLDQIQGIVAGLACLGGCHCPTPSERL
jgi:hypothetical protein